MGKLIFKKLKRVKTLFLEFLSFSSPRAIVFNLLFILIFLRVLPLKLLENGPRLCVFSRILELIYRGNCPTSGLFSGCACPSCGLTRGIAHLLRGDLISAYTLNKGVILVFLVILIAIIWNLILFLRQRKAKKPKVLKRKGN
ncbi:DUF2752 domain-containing protein [Candidatus Woesearchaeota archaeon]|nr:DUF2752 domain-containing protein [Candidatus Woesearchaeota archaeon]